MELRDRTATLSPLPMPSPPLAERALASRFTLSWSWTKVRLSPSQTMAPRFGTTEAAVIRNSEVFIRCLRLASCSHPREPWPAAGGGPGHAFLGVGAGQGAGGAGGG